MHYRSVKGILSSKNGMNLYRGCQHGCIYCDSRSNCYQMQHPFEDIEVKENALVLLEYTLRHKRKPCMIGTGAMSDPYIPLEEDLRYTRKALELILRYGYGVALHTKSDRILQDLDLLRAIHAKTKCVVQITLTTYNESLCRILEPNVCTTYKRVEVLKTLRDAGIPTIVWLCPILPFINDTMENLNGILDYCQEADVQGVICFNMGVTLRSGNREYFYRKLDTHFPGLKDKYINHYGNAYILNSPNNAELMQQFHHRCEQAGIMHNNNQIFQYLSRFEEKPLPQLSFF